LQQHVLNRHKIIRIATTLAIKDYWSRWHPHWVQTSPNETKSTSSRFDPPTASLHPHQSAINETSDRRTLLSKVKHILSLATIHSVYSEAKPKIWNRFDVGRGPHYSSLVHPPAFWNLHKLYQLICFALRPSLQITSRSLLHHCKS
jgi:hypothetical protein